MVFFDPDPLDEIIDPWGEMYREIEEIEELEEEQKMADELYDKMFAPPPIFADDDDDDDEEW